MRAHQSTFSTNTRIVPPHDSPTFQAVSSATPNSIVFGLPLAITSSASVTTAPSTQLPDTALPPLGVDRYTAFVALTHDPKVDDPALLHALERECFYIGALGSRKTHGRRIERLKGQGASDDALARIHAPIGLPIGAISPPEIAVAIMGEITSRLRLTPEGKR